MQVWRLDCDIAVYRHLLPHVTGRLILPNVRSGHQAFVPAGQWIYIVFLAHIRTSRRGRSSTSRPDSPRTLFDLRWGASDVCERLVFMLGCWYGTRMRFRLHCRFALTSDDKHIEIKYVLTIKNSMLDNLVGNFKMSYINAYRSNQSFHWKCLSLICS